MAFEIIESSDEQVVLSDVNKIKKVLRELQNNPTTTYKKLEEATSFSCGVLSRAVKDARIMNLLDEMRLTTLGHEWANQTDIIPTEIMRKAGLYVPLFKAVYRAIPNESDPIKVIEKISDLASNLDKKIISRATKKYLELIHGKKIKTRFRIKEDEGEANSLKQEDKKINISAILEIQRINLPIVDKYGIDNIIEVLQAMKNS